MIGPGNWGRAVPLVLAAAGALVLAVELLRAQDRAPRTTGGAVTVGEYEPVRLSVEGESVEARARIDTGASRSAIDEELADDLDLDLDDAETVTVRSALGREERPLADVTLRLAGRNLQTTVAVSDRSKLSAPVLIGRRDLAGVRVAVGSTELTERGSFLGAAFTERAALGSSGLLAVVPLGVALVLLARAALGRAVLPVAALLVALAAAQSGVALGLAAAVLAPALALVAWPLLRRVQPGAVPSLAAALVAGLLGLVALSAQALAGVDTAAVGTGAAVPVIAGALLAERMLRIQEVAGLRPAVLAGAATLLVSLSLVGLLAWQPLRLLAHASPLALAGVGLLWACLAVLSPRLRRPPGSRPATA